MFCGINIHYTLYIFKSITVIVLGENKCGENNKRILLLFFMNYKRDFIKQFLCFFFSSISISVFIIPIFSILIDVLLFIETKNLCDNASWNLKSFEIKTTCKNI